MKNLSDPFSLFGLVICLAIAIYYADGRVPRSSQTDHGTPLQPFAQRNAEKPEPRDAENQADPLIEDLDFEIDDKRVDAMIRVPIDKWHVERTNNIGRETVAQLVENLADFDDMHLAMTSTGHIIPNGTYASAAHQVAHLFRVRRLLALEEEFPGTVRPVAVDAYAKSLNAWPAAYQDWSRRFNGPGERNYEPLDVDKVSTRATVATYLLGEAGDVSSIKVLLDGYQTQQQWIETYKRAGRAQAPAPPAFTLYAIHRIVSSAPEAGLSPGARAARGDYLSWAQEHIPSVTRVEVSAWKATRDESDPFRKVADPEGASLADQPKMMINVYPSRFNDGTEFEPDGVPFLPEKGEEWRKRVFAAASAMLGG